jgi:hypothetical protein
MLQCLGSNLQRRQYTVSLPGGLFNLVCEIYIYMLETIEPFCGRREYMSCSDLARDDLVTDARSAHSRVEDVGNKWTHILAE